MLVAEKCQGVVAVVVVVVAVVVIAVAVVVVVGCCNNVNKHTILHFSAQLYSALWYWLQKANCFV